MIEGEFWERINPGQFTIYRFSLSILRNYHAMQFMILFQYYVIKNIE